MAQTSQNTTLVLKHAANDLPPARARSVSGAEDMAAYGRFFEALATGFKAGDIVVDIHRGTTNAAPVAASGTITLATCAADTIIEINGVEFVALASGTAVVANNEFVISGTDTADATALKNAINASTSAGIAGVVTATSALGVVTVTASKKGVIGNGVTIKAGGIKAKALITMAAVAAADTVTINGQALTATKQRASSTLTFTSAVATDAVVINGVTFTGVAGAAVYGSNQFSIDTSDAAAAADLAAAVNASTEPLISGIVTASSAAGVCTIKAVAAGGSSAITLVSNDATIVASAATLEGGTAVANNQFDIGGTNTQDAAWLAAAINASTSAIVLNHAKAISNAAVVTVRSKHSGTIGNSITIATSNGTRLAITGSLSRLGSGTEASVGVQASGTVTIAAGGSGNYTVTVNGVSSGNVAWDTDEETTANDILVAMNGIVDVLTREQVTFSVSGAVVTVTALKGGVSGNVITLGCTGTGATASGARLAGGAAPTTAVVSGDRLASGVGGDSARVSYTY